jgi:hypothetical protein
MIRWIIYFPFIALVEILTTVLAPLICLFVVKREYTDRVKRRGNAQFTMQREFLPKYLYWFQYPDNAVDEYFWCSYNVDSFLPYLRNATEEQYESSPFLRYFCRVMWLWRNSGGGFNTYLFGAPVEEGVKSQVGSLVLTKRPSSFQLKGIVQISERWSMNINMGWKQLGEVERLTYAGRFFSLRFK